MATVKRAAPIVSVAGEKVDLGLVGSPVSNGTPQLLTDLLARGYVPVIACIGATRDGQLMNVNADTLASHIAGALRARRLVIAGGTSGVLDEQGATIARLTARDASRMIKAGTANKGMVAKLQACTAALMQGVGDVLIANGRSLDFEQLAAARHAHRRHNPGGDAMKPTFDEIQAKESQHVLQTYRRQPVAFVRGEGPRLYDVDGREYLDLVSGIGVTSLGHAHPGLTAAIAEQAATLLHTSNLYFHPFQAEAAASPDRAVWPESRVLLQQRLGSE